MTTGVNGVGSIYNAVFFVETWGAEADDQFVMIRVSSTVPKIFLFISPAMPDAIPHVTRIDCTEVPQLILLYFININKIDLRRKRRKPYNYQLIKRALFPYNYMKFVSESLFFGIYTKLQQRRTCWYATLCFDAGFPLLMNLYYLPFTGFTAVLVSRTAPCIFPCQISLYRSCFGM